jgi:hypothetical protein
MLTRISAHRQLHLQRLQRLLRWTPVAVSLLALALSACNSGAGGGSRPGY